MPTFRRRHSKRQVSPRSTNNWPASSMGPILPINPELAGQGLSLRAIAGSWIARRPDAVRLGNWSATRFAVLDRYGGRRRRITPRRTVADRQLSGRHPPNEPAVCKQSKPLSKFSGSSDISEGKALLEILSPGAGNIAASGETLTRARGRHFGRWKVGCKRG